MIVEIGSGPYEEDVAQVGDSDYLEMSKLELTTFRDQIRRRYPKVKKLEDQGRIQLKIKSSYHDFGSYRELVIKVDESDEEAVDLAFSVESDDKGVLARWDRASKAAMISGTGARMTESESYADAAQRKATRELSEWSSFLDAPFENESIVLPSGGIGWKWRASSPHSVLFFGFIERSGSGVLKGTEYPSVANAYEEYIEMYQHYFSV